MNGRFIRVYQKLDIKEIRKHLLIFGALSANCAHCSKLDIPLNAPQCPQCGMEFKYIAFTNIKDHLPKLSKLLAERPGVVLVDHDDYKRAIGELKAKEFLQ